MARDITADIGPLYRDGWDPKIPMYSYERPAYIFWQAVFEGLVEAGKTEEQAIDWLQSKGPRHMLDGPIGEVLRDIGRRVGKEFGHGAQTD